MLWKYGVSHVFIARWHSRMSRFIISIWDITAMKIHSSVIVVDKLVPISSHLTYICYKQNIDFNDCISLVAVLQSLLDAMARFFFSFFHFYFILFQILATVFLQQKGLNLNCDVLFSFFFRPSIQCHF